MGRRRSVHDRTPDPGILRGILHKFQSAAAACRPGVRSTVEVQAERGAQPVVPLLHPLLGKVEIPRLRLSAVVFQGTEDSVLDHGVGHLDGSPLPGQSGNVVLAAHRDTFFRSLKDIHEGDVVSVSTPSGIRSYSVESTEIVAPTDTSVLNATDTPTLTLITCYPFYYVGHAPKRFIVRARDTQAVPARAAQPAQLLAQKSPPQQKETARIAPSRRPTPEEIENLTYVFRASQ